MNCKPGDLAIVVPPSDNSGLIVRVIRPAIGDHFSGLPSWFVTSAGRPLEAQRKDGSRRSAMAAQCPDAWLRPVSGLPINDEVTDDIKDPA
jgi:hypothetical protein